MADKLSRYRQLLQQPQVRALLNTIRYAEGTSGETGYQTMFGGGQFSDMSRHPDKVISSGKYKSAAAGAYQFLPGTWRDMAGELGLKKFGPAEQDVAAIGLIERRGALDPFLRGEKFGKVIDKLAPEWASLPTAQGGSYYGQPSKSLGDLYRVYEEQKKLAASGPQAPVAATPGDQRSVEEILSSVLTGANKPGLEQTNKKATSLVDTIKGSLIQSLMTPLINPLGML